MVHVSQLASHTKDMLDSPRVSLMVVAPVTSDKPPQATARATVQGRAEQIADSDPDYAAAREAYLATFPQSVDMFELADFSLFAIRPLSIRLISGFAQAVTLTPGAFATALKG